MLDLADTETMEPVAPDHERDDSEKYADLLVMYILAREVARKARRLDDLHLHAAFVVVE